MRENALRQLQARGWVLVNIVRGLFGMQIPNYFVEPSTALYGAGLALAIGFAGGLIPAVRLARLKTVDVLREGA